MNVRLTPQQRQFIQSEIDAGRYLTEAEVIREALRLLQEEKEWKRELRRKIAEGMEAIKAKQVVDGDETFDELLSGLNEESAS